MRFRTCLAVVSLIAVAAPAWAESSTETTPSSSTQSTYTGSSGFGWEGWGVRVGVADSADQVVGGAHFNLGEVFSHVRFQPDVQIGAGDDVTTLYGTAPLFYRFGGSRRMTPYAGGGLALGWADSDAPAGSSGSDSNDFGIGAKATGGLEWARSGDQAFFVELSVGFGDVHDAQIVAAWTF